MTPIDDPSSVQALTLINQVLISITQSNIFAVLPICRQSENALDRRHRIGAYHAGRGKNMADFSAFEQAALL